jgi:AmiR/NasT family two-component response regulator
LMSCAKIWIAPHLRVLVADADRSYGAGLRSQLARLGFRTVDEAVSPQDAQSRMGYGDYDIVLVEIAAAYRQVWDALDLHGPGAALVVGMSLDRSGEDWIEAIRQGADAILMKAFYTHLLQPVLAHMLASPAARRCRLVQMSGAAPAGQFDIEPIRRFGSRAKPFDG